MILGTLDKNGYEKTNRVWGVGGVAPCVEGRDYKDPIRICISVNKLGNLSGFTGGSFAGNVYGKNGLCPVLNSMNGGGQTANGSR